MLVGRVKEYAEIVGFFAAAVLLSTVVVAIGILSETWVYMLLTVLAFGYFHLVWQIHRHMDSPSVQLPLIGILFLSISIIFTFILGIFVTNISAIGILSSGHACGNVDLLNGLYWATATLTTVGYGDFAPCSSVGKILAIYSSWLGVTNMVTFIAIIGDTFTRKGKVASGRADA